MSYTSDSLTVDTPLDVRSEYRLQPVEFEVGQHFEFEVSNQNYIGTLDFEVERVLRGRVLINGILTYYMIMPGENGPKTIRDEPIIIGKSFWINTDTYGANSQDYIPQIWNAHIEDSSTILRPNMLHKIELDSIDDSIISHTHRRYSERIPFKNPPTIKKIYIENEQNSDESTAFVRFEKEALRFSNNILRNMNIPIRLVK